MKKTFFILFLIFIACNLDSLNVLKKDDSGSSGNKVSSSFTKTWQHHEAMYSGYLKIESDGNAIFCMNDKINGKTESKTCIVNENILTCSGEAPQNLSMDGSHMAVATPTGPAIYGKIDDLPSECNQSIPATNPTVIKTPEEIGTASPTPVANKTDASGNETVSSFVGKWQHHEAMYSAYYEINKEGSSWFCKNDKVTGTFDKKECTVNTTSIICNNEPPQTLTMDGSHLVVSTPTGPATYGKFDAIPGECDIN